MGIHVQVRLRFLAKYLHLVLVQAFVRAELQLRRAVQEVHVADGVPHVFAPVARFGALERGSAALRETGLGAVSRSFGRGEKVGRAQRYGSFAPAALDIRSDFITACIIYYYISNITEGYI